MRPFAELGLEEFWQEHLPEAREAIRWGKVLELLVVNRLIEPGSEYRLHRHRGELKQPWFAQTGRREAQAR